jgi:hypothetical protein
MPYRQTEDDGCQIIARAHMVLGLGELK